ncbi:MAG TPA: tetratricopeptide repeat protein [Micropepsaceae bacterium]|nr:tetratricopeptide repeat protein [Micropepsaceae bacterium]
MNESLLRTASSLGGAGRLAEAAAIYRQVLQQEPRNYDALHALGVIYFRSGQLREAEQMMAQAAGVNPRAAAAFFDHGCVLMAAGRFEEAQDRFNRAISIRPDFVEARGNRVHALMRLGRHPEALAESEHLVRMRPNLPQAHASRAGALQALNRPQDALASLDRATQLAPAASGLWADRAQALMALGRPAEALASVEQAIKCEPGNGVFPLMRGDLLVMLNRYQEAVAAYDAGLKLRPNVSDAWNRRGIALAQMGRKAEGLESFDKAIRIDPGHSEARNNRANILFGEKRFPEAAREFEQVLRAAPDSPYAAGFLIQSRLRSCDWSNLEKDRERLAAGIAKGERLIDPQGYLSICTNPQSQLHCARIVMQDEGAAVEKGPPSVRHRASATPATSPAGGGGKEAHALDYPSLSTGEETPGATGRRIRIAYLSADFRPHPVAFLIAGVFEHHDRNAFELTGVSLVQAGDSPIRNRIRAAFENFIDAAGRTDDDIAQELSRREIDIAVDLTGFTDGSRPAIMLRRPAPIQVNFLGFPGTMGSREIDYIIADRWLIPETARLFYDEKVVWMPHTYQANDSKREISDRVFTRRDMGLPEDGFVFCCFNNNYKVTPEIFAVWMRLLSQVPDSVLWLLKDNDAAAVNLRREAEARGVDANRLIFAARIAPADHFARQHLGDLFLDTSPYSAHTTGSDALFAGLPVISVYGATFPARVAVSLLHAAGMSELAMDSLDSYEAKALFFAQNREALKAIRSKLARSRDSAPLFNTALFTRHLEAAYRQMITLNRNGAGPQAFAVEAGA